MELRAKSDEESSAAYRRYSHVFYEARMDDSFLSHVTMLVFLEANQESLVWGHSCRKLPRRPACSVSCSKKMK